MLVEKVSSLQSPEHFELDDDLEHHEVERVELDEVERFELDDFEESIQNIFSIQNSCCPLFDRIQTLTVNREKEDRVLLCFNNYFCLFLSFIIIFSLNSNFI